MMRVLAICGSLRRGSYNMGLLRAAAEVAHEADLDVEIYESIRDIPPYNEDDDTDERRPPVVEALKQLIRDVDGVLIATPEYNYSIPGQLKNVIDWAARPPRGSPLNRKPVALMGASTGMSGTIRAQLALRQTFIFTDSLALLQPEVLIPKCAERFDPGGNLVDGSTRALIGRQMQAFAAWIRLVNAAPEAAVGVKG